MLADYLHAYSDMLNRDVDRLDYIVKNMKITMGAGALAGTPLDADVYKVKVSAVLKEKDKIPSLLNIQAAGNSIDTVSDRDFVIEILCALSIIGMHLSRLSEDLIIWSTEEFGFVEIDESFCTGSSLMPHKKNPDALELIRGYAGRLYGNLVSVLTMMKGLPLTYNRDMQLDKEPLFNSFELVSLEVKALTGLISTLRFNEDNIKQHLEDESLYVTDLVYCLVNKRIPFKDAHTIVGKLVKYSIDNSIKIKDMPESLLRKFSNKFIKTEVIKLFNPEISVYSKKSIKRKRYKMTRK
jgi:argininosuccinate lyase